MSRPKRDIFGQRFGRLFAVARIEMTVVAADIIRRSGRGSVWLCLCDCGTWIPVPLGNLTSGNTSSCGCERGTVRRKMNKAAERDWHGRILPGTRKANLQE